MRTLLLLFFLPAIISCNALGGIQPEAISALRDAGGGCVYVESLVMGKAILTVAHDTKGGIKNGGVSIGANCAINLTDTQTIPVPTGATVTTTVVQPAK